MSALALLVLLLNSHLQQPRLFPPTRAPPLVAVSSSALTLPSSSELGWGLRIIAVLAMSDACDSGASAHSSLSPPSADLASSHQHQRPLQLWSMEQFPLASSTAGPSLHRPTDGFEVGWREENWFGSADLAHIRIQSTSGFHAPAGPR